jgi:predicted Fe-S protein YdhL (DUF1289 family)
MLLSSISVRPSVMIVSPCEKICIVDPVSGLCRGCGRSLTEIERWTSYSAAERTRVMAELPQRLDAMRARDARPATS